MLLDYVFKSNSFVYHGSWKLDNSIIYGLGNPVQNPHHPGAANLVILKVQLPTAQEAYKELVKAAPAEILPPDVLQTDVVAEIPLANLPHRHVFLGCSIKDFVTRNKKNIKVKVTMWERYIIHTIIWAPNGGPCRFSA
jgi:hypothetical protein